MKNTAKFDVLEITINTRKLSLHVHGLLVIKDIPFLRAKGEL